MATRSCQWCATGASATGDGVPMAHAQSSSFACQTGDIVPRVMDRPSRPKASA